MKTLRKNKLLTIVLAVFMSLCAFIGILATVPRPASADTTETVDISALVEKEYDGTAAAGRYFRAECGSNNAFALYFDGANASLYVTESGFQLVDRENITFHDLQEEFAMPEMISCYRGTKEDGSANYIFEFYIPEGVAKGKDGALSIDFNAKGFTVDSMVTEGFYELVNPNEAQPSEKEEPNIIDDVKDWFVQAGDDISAWFGDNAGIEISGGGVLTIGAIILICLVLFKKKK